MIDQNSQFFAILTAVGEAKQANADALGIPWKLTHLGVGDANGTDPIPDRLQTHLLNERRRAPLNQLKIDPANPAVLIAEQVIPADVGGWWVREIGLYDEAGDLVAIANCAPSFKPVLSQGSGRTQIVRMNFIVSSVGNIVLKIDPSVVLATREYVDSSIIAVLPPNKVAGTFTKVTINNRGIVQGGSNPTTLAGYGITDALPSAGGDVTGDVSLVGARSVNVLANSLGQWAGGIMLRTGVARTLSGGLGGYGNGDDLSCVYMGLGNTPWLGNGVRVRSDGVEVEGILSGNGNGLTNLKWSALNGVPTTLNGYGITQASQAEAEAGSDTDKPMNALRVFQAITAKVIQATESALGIARIATQALTNAGVDDTTIVTPKKLRFGFSILLAVNGYIVFPTWMGGLIIQWGRVSVAASTTTAFSLPIPFPMTFFAGICQSMTLSMSTTYTTGFGLEATNLNSARIQNNYSGSALTFGFIAIGN